MKKYAFASLVVGLAFIPSCTFAEEMATTSVSVTQGVVTPAQVFTSCSQTTITKRDEAIAAARTLYNTGVTQALTARTEAEKAAAAITDPVAKKAAVKAAADTHKAATKAADATLASARKAAWSTFETDSKACREAKQKALAKVEAEKKAAREKIAADKKAALEKAKADKKAAEEAAKNARKAIRTGTTTAGTR